MNCSKVCKILRWKVTYLKCKAIDEYTLQIITNQCTSDAVTMMTTHKWIVKTRFSVKINEESVQKLKSHTVSRNKRHSVPLPGYVLQFPTNSRNDALNSCIYQRRKLNEVDFECRCVAVHRIFRKVYTTDRKFGSINVVTFPLRSYRFSRIFLNMCRHILSAVESQGIRCVRNFNKTNAEVIACI